MKCCLAATTTTTTTTRLSNTLVVLLALVGTLSVTQAQVPVDPNVCACPWAEDNEKDCHVYGPNPDDGGQGLVAYPPIQEECIRDIGARLATLDALEFWIYCPHPNHTEYNLEQFAILLRDDTPTEPAQYVMSQFIADMDFAIFAKDESTNLYGLPEIITNNLAGREYNCTERETECWNQAKAQMRNRYPRWDIICGHWHETLIPLYQQEQGLARKLICQGGYNETELEHCQPIVDVLQPRDNCDALQAIAKPRDSGVVLCNETKSPSPNSAAVGTTMMTTVVSPVMAALLAWMVL